MRRVLASAGCALALGLPSFALRAAEAPAPPVYDLEQKERALCRGRPCAMGFPLRMTFEVDH